MVVTRNIDALFGLKHGFYAAGDCAFGRPSHEERDACALFCHKRPDYFNAGGKGLGAGMVLSVCLLWCLQVMD